MKISSKILLLILLILFISFSFLACNGDGVIYENIDSITVDETSIADGFLISDFNIEKVMLNIKYFDTKDAKGNTVTGETVQIPATLDMVIAEDKAQLSVPGKKTITLRYGKFDISFVLQLFEDTVKKHKVIFLKEDDSQLGDTQYVIDGGKAVQPTVPVKPGFDFIGWVDRSTNTPASYDNIQKETILQVRYAAKEYNVTYYTRVINNNIDADDSVGGEETTPTVIIKAIGSPVKVPRGQNAIDYAPEIPVIQGYSNGRWENVEAMEEINSDTAFYAIYDQDTVVLTFNYKKYDSTSYDEQKNYYVGSKVEDNFDVEQKGYKFVGWFTESNKEIIFPYTVTNEMRFIAKYVTVSEDSDEHGLDYSIAEEEYKLLESIPFDWNNNWKNYYVKNGEVYDIVTDEVRPTWQADTYYSYRAEYTIIKYDGTARVVVIPDKYNGFDVTGISPGVFADCAIKEFVVSTQNKYFKVDEGVLYNFNKDRLLAYPSLKTDASFNVQRGDNNKVYSIADKAFKNAKNLVNVDLGAYLIDIGEYAFSECTNLASITIPEKVTTINSGAFKMTKPSALTSITFSAPSELTTIEYEAFYGLNRLTSIDIPSSVTTIGSGVFTLCKSLESIQVAENNLDFKVSDGGGPNVCSAGGLYDSGFTTLYCYPANYSVINDTDIILPSSLTLIKSGAFSYTKLQGIYITSDSITLESNSVVLPNLVYLRVDASSLNYTSSFKDSFGKDSFGEHFIPRHIFVEKEALKDQLIASDLNTDIQIFDEESWQELQDFENNFIYEYVTTTIADVEKTTITILGGRSTSASLVIPDALGVYNVTKIASFAFYNDENIITVILPNAVEEVGKKAFANMPNLTTLYINDNLSIIGDSAFASSVKLSRVQFSELVEITSMGREVFANTLWYQSEEEEYLTINGLLLKYNGYDISAKVASEITYIASDAFANKSNLTSVVFESRVLHTIGYRAFQSCTGLIEVLLPSSITTIEEEAFVGCSKLLLATINAPEGGINIHSTAFPNNDDLKTNIRFEGDTPFTLSYRFEESDTGSVTGIIFFENTINVKDDANRKFAGWYEEQEFINLVTFPLTLTENKYIYAKFIPANEGSEGLEYRLVDNTYTVTGYTGSDNYVIIPQRHKNMIVNAIDDNAFANNETVVSINFPYNLNTLSTYITSVGENVFDNTLWYKNYRGDFIIINDMLIKYKGSASIVEVPSSIKKIADGAFSNNMHITKVVIPEGVLSLGKNMFRNCTNLTTVTLPSTIISIQDYAFADCENLVNINFETAQDLVEISSSALDGTLWLSDRIDDCIIINGKILYKYQGYQGEEAGGIGLKKRLTIMNGITQIADRAFENTSLSKVYIPESVQFIGDYAFYGSKINEVSIFSGGSDLVGIGEYAFANCLYLSKINLSVCQSLFSISDYAFANTAMLYSSSLSVIALPSNLTEMGEGVFSNSGLVNVAFASGSKLKAIPKNAFVGCSNLSSVIFNGNSALTVIGENAFYGCDSLIEFSNVNANIERIEAGAFYNCTRLKNFDINSSKLKEIGIGALYELGYVKSFNANLVIIGNILIKYEGTDTIIDIPYTITTIYDSAFSGNTTISTINFPANSKIDSINDKAFYNCINLENINFPNTIKNVGNDVVTNTLWYENQIRSDNEFITIGNTLIRYNGSARQVVIPNSINIINKDAFNGVELYDIQIGSQVTLINEGAFDGIIRPAVTHEKGIYIGVECGNEDEFAAQKTNGITIYYKLKEDYIPTATYIQGLNDYYIFDDSIQTITENVNWSLTLLNPKPFEMKENTVFEIYLESETAKEDYLLDRRWDSYVDYLKVLKSFTVELSVESDKGSVEQASVTSAMIYEKIPLTVIDGNEFIGWYVDPEKKEALKYPIKLNHGFTLYAKFVNYVDGSQEGFSCIPTTENIEITRYNDYYDATIVVPRQVADYEFTMISGDFIPANPPQTYGTHVWNADLEMFVIENDEEIATHFYLGAMEGHNEIEVVYFANNSKITTIGQYAFKDCTSLRKIVLPASITKIATGAFSGCTSLTEIVFATDSTASIILESEAFKGCTALKKIMLPGNITEWGDGAFAGCTSLVDIYMGDTEVATVESITGILPFDDNEGKIKIYVNSSVYLNYKERWSSYVSYFVEVTDEE